MDANWLGELGLAVFNFAQLRSRKHALYVFGGLLHGIRADDEVQKQIIKVVLSGLSIGLNARCVYAERVEDNLGETTHQVREWLNINPYKGHKRLEMSSLNRA